MKAQEIINLVKLSGNVSEEELKAIQEMGRLFEGLEESTGKLMFHIGSMLLNGTESPFDSKTIVEVLQSGTDIDIPEACFILGLLYMQGKGVNQDVKKGEGLIIKGADLGLSDAQIYLGHLYFRGTVGPKNYARAAIYYRRAARQNDDMAMFFLGTMYSSGKGVPQNLKVSELYARRALENNRNNEQYQQGYTVVKKLFDISQGQNEANSGLLELIYNAETGSMKAEYELANCYLSGKGVEPDDEQAAEWCRLSAGHGYALAENLLGTLYLNGRGVEQNSLKAVEWFQKAAKQDFWKAIENLGLCYKKGEGVERDYAMALEWFNKGADSGDRGCTYQLGLMYKEGLGVPQDFAKSMEIFLQANRPIKPTYKIYYFYADAAYTIGEMYEKGEGVERNLVMALLWYHWSTKAYTSPSQDGQDAENRLLEMADKWEHENNPQKRDPQGFDTFLAKYIIQEARRSNYITLHLMEWLGRSYYFGSNTVKDYKQAIYWLRMAVQWGTNNPDVWEALGDMYRDGIEVLQNYEKAVSYYQTASQLDSRSGKYSMAAMYELGHGVQQDYNKALTFYLEVVEQGYADASQDVDRIRALIKQERAKNRKGFFRNLFGK